MCDFVTFRCTSIGGSARTIPKYQKRRRLGQAERGLGIRIATQHHDLMAGLQQPTNEVVAQKTGRAGDEYALSVAHRSKIFWKV